MASFSSLSLSFPSHSSSGNWEYDVFPSFHGPDVRKSFLSHVLKEFKRKAINLFIDNDIKRGDFIGPALKGAIRGSKIAVVLLSKNYASSSWCLDELVEIMNKELGQIVITIFYDVDPTDIRKQTNHFGEVFKKTCEGKDKKKIATWRKALADVATIAGYHSSVWNDEASMIQKIAVDISDMLNDLTPSLDFENFTGLENHMEMIKPLLHLDSNEVITIGIWGPPGIGKTTIVRHLFNKISNGFQNRAFMEDIKGTYPKICFDEYEAKLQLQKKMMSKMIDQSDIVISHLGVAKQRLRNRKVLLVLDDVDRLAQLDALAGNVQWFGLGSRIIITTEDRRLLRTIGINHIYKVNYPLFDEALEMFCMYAFQKKLPEDGFYELACEITCLVGQLPLGLKVMGSYFRGLCKDKERWSMEARRLRNNLNGDIERILKFSYDALCDEDKDLFLQIACFFEFEKLSNVEKFLAPRFKDLRQRIYDLVDKSLISLEGTSYVKIVIIHELLAQLGKNIVRKELVRASGNHQFLNDYKDACQMLTGKKVTNDYKDTCQMLTGQYYEQKSRVLYDSGHPIIIYWRQFPSTCLDFTNKMEFLVELKLIYSKLEKLWEETKLLRNLKLLDLSCSYDLKELPDLSMATNLEELNLEYCYSLVSLPQLPESLSNLNAEDCPSLKKLDCSFGKAVNQLNFIKCFNLNKEARNLIIQTLTLGYAVLPGKEVPACFTNRASGSYVTVKLNQNHLPSSTKFKACILVGFKVENQIFFRHHVITTMRVSCSITSKQKNYITARTPYSKDIFDFPTEHLYIFDIKAEEVTSTELDFTFELTTYDHRKKEINGDWEIKECGVLSILGTSCLQRRDLQNAGYSHLWP